jgi:hypothetical protein
MRDTKSLPRHFARAGTSTSTRRDEVFTLALVELHQRDLILSYLHLGFFLIALSRKRRLTEGIANTVYKELL